MNKITRLAAMMCLITAPAMAITPINGGSISGATPVTINVTNGDQTDPHVSGDIAAYTDVQGSTIRYFNFTTGVDAAIPAGPGVIDILSDVSGNLIAFSRIEADRNAIMLFSMSTGTLTEIDPHAGSNRLGAAIGGNIIAFIDLTSGGGDVYAYDVSSSTLQAISKSAASEQNPNVSPGGDVIVWEQCPTSLTNCDVMKAMRSAGSWTASIVANSPDPEGNPDTNGTTIVYDANHPGNPTGQDVYIVPVAGGATIQLEIPGDQANPSISGGVIAFESRATPTSDSDIYLYVIATNTLYQVMNTPAVNETLNDVSVLTNGQVRIAWSADDGPSGAQNVYATTFTLPSVCRQYVLDASVTMSAPALKPSFLPHPPVFHDALIIPKPALTFWLPQKLTVVGGNAGTGFSELALLHNRALTSCFYQGTNGGTEYDLFLCLPAESAGVSITGDDIALRVWSELPPTTSTSTTEVKVTLQDATCAN